MHEDIRSTALYQEVEALHRAVHRPASGLISDAVDISTNGTQVVFAGTLVESFEGVAATRVCCTNLANGDTRLLTFGPNIDRLPKFSPDGKSVAFLSDRHKAGDFQLYVLDVVTGAARRAPPVNGWVESLHWSPDSLLILLGVAAHGVDAAGVSGAVVGKPTEPSVPAWMPNVEGQAYEGVGWRSAAVYELTSNTVRHVGEPGSNIWEAAWCGTNAIATIVSPSPNEAAWYSAHLSMLDLATGKNRELYRPKAQLGWPAASPDGRQLVIVEGLCSDRWLVAGDLLLLDIATGSVRQVDTRGVDITYAEWRSNRKLLLAGHRGLEAVIAIYDAPSNAFSEVWASEEITAATPLFRVAGFGDCGDCVLIGEGFTRAPEVAVLRDGHYKAIRSFDQGYAAEASVVRSAEPVRWRAPDGLQIQGWLLRPRVDGPHPLIMNIHGGPVWNWRALWLGRGSATTLMLLKHGYAVFMPNPRGSSGRGQPFVRAIVGDLGGVDALDCLSGLNFLIECGIADPLRLGITGASYGGFMTSWLITQDSRFAAAVSVAPFTNNVSEQLTSNISHFVSMFLADSYIHPDSRYFHRSPIFHAHRTRTPMLNICGARDRCTPPTEAVQFHGALRENGVKSGLVIYPEEGHGVRKYPAMIDFAARVVSWFETHMPARGIVTAGFKGHGD